MIDLKTKRKLAEEICVVSVAGELDMYTAPALERELLGALQEDAQEVLVDLTECQFLESTALGILVSARRTLVESGRSLSLVTADRNVRRAFELTGLDRLFAIHATRAAAMNGHAHDG